MLLKNEKKNMGSNKDNLPKQWALTTLELIADITMGTSPNGDSYNAEGNGIPLINGPTEFGQTAFSTTKLIQYTSSPTKYCKKNDLLMCVRGATTGRTSIAGFDACIGRGVAAINSQINQWFVNYYIFSKRYVLLSLGTGSTFPSISSEQLRKFYIPLPPLPEQHRIVKKIEELFTKLDAGVEALKKVKAQVKRYRQAVLKYAFEGKLTEEWREKHNVRFVEVKRHNPDDIIIFGKKLPKIPTNWSYKKLDDLIKDIKYGTAKKCGYEKIGVPVIRIPNIKYGLIDQHDLKFTVLPEEELKLLSLVEGDLLLIRSNGSVSLLGQTAIVRETEKGYAYAGYLIRLRFYKREMYPYYINYALSSYNSRLQIETPARSTSGVNNINSDEVRNIIIPVPLLEEQHQIVSEIERHFSIADEVEKMADQSLRQAERLRQSILKRAFEGKLLPQDPDDEPAEILLERIRKERENTERNTGTKRRKVK